MNNLKLATKITRRILRMEGLGQKEGDRLAIMVTGKNFKETSLGGRNKQCLISTIEEELNKSNFCIRLK